MKVIQRTIVSPNPPKDKNVTWIDTSSPDARVERIYQNGEWLEVGAAQGTLDYTDLENKPKINSTELSGDKTASELGLMGIIDSPIENEVLVTDAQGQAVSSGKSFDDLVAVPTNEGTNGQLLQSNGDGTTTWVTPSAGTTPDASMSTTSTNAVQNKVITAELDKYAKTDGYYSTLTVGSAENLVGQTVDSEAYLIRPTGGAESEVANGVASVLGMEGNSAVWNQLVQNGDFSNGTTGWIGVGDTYASLNIEADGSCSSTVDSEGSAAIKHNISIIANHTYYIKYTAKGSSNFNAAFNYGGGSQAITTSFKEYKGIYSQGTSATIALNMFVYQRTALIGEKLYMKSCEVIDLTILGIDNLTTTAQVEEWLAQHVGTKPYYAYNAGTILSAQTLGIKTYGQNLLNPTTKQAKLIPYTWIENGVTYSNQYTVKNIPSGATATYTPDNTGVAESVTITDNTFDISSYGSGVLELSAATANTYVCMKWDEQKDDDVVPYEDYTYNFDMRKVYGKVSGDDTLYQCYQNGMQNVNGTADLLKADESISRIGKRAYQSGDESDATVLTDKTNTLYVLETPITYTDLIYRDNGVDRPLADVLFNIEVNNWSMEEQLLTPYDNGNPTSIPATIKTQYGMDAVEAIDTLQKTCYFADDVHANLQALLTCINTNCAETLGGTFEISETATDKVFDFTFTPNTEPEP